MIFRELALGVIDFENETYRISEDVFSAPLLASMREIGQLNPVVLLEGDAGYAIVCGFRRLNALKELGMSKVSARILEENPAEPQGAFDIALWDNLSHRSLEPLEKARAAFKLKNDFGVSEETLIQVYLPRLGLPPHKQTLHMYSALHGLHPELRHYFKEGRLTLASVGHLAQMSPSSRESIASAMRNMRLSASLQRKFFGLMEDLAAISGTEPGEILEDAQVKEVLNNDRLSPGERGDGVYAILYRSRYPRVSRAGELFQEQKKSLGLPGTVRVTADPYFESPDLRVEFTASDPERFRKLATELFEASRKPELDRLFRVIE